MNDEVDNVNYDVDDGLNGEAETGVEGDVSMRRLVVISGGEDV